MKTIFVDMDGVLADFDKRAEEVLGMAPAEYEAKFGASAFWAALGEDFYYDLPLMPDAIELMAGVYDLAGKSNRNVKILTGVPSSISKAGKHKIAWAAEYFPAAPTFVCEAKLKKDYCSPGDILIDDRPKYKGLWESIGGVWITHTSATASLAELRRALVMMEV